MSPIQIGPERRERKARKDALTVLLLCVSLVAAAAVYGRIVQTHDTHLTDTAACADRVTGGLEKVSTDEWRSAWNACWSLPPTPEN